MLRHVAVNSAAATATRVSLEPGERVELRSSVYEIESSLFHDRQRRTLARYAE
jgi:hypothetical protein